MSAPLPERRLELLPAEEELDLSLAIPCYNEASHLRESAAELLRVLDGTRYRYEVVFVDDCSRDETRVIIQEVCARHPRCRYVFHERNQGRGGAFKTGWRATRGRITGFIDIDLEVHARYVPALVDLIDRGECDVATGYRHYLLSQTGAIHRHVLSWNYRVLTKALLGLGVQDSETGCKFFRRDRAAVVLESQSDGWFWDTEVMSRASLADLRIRELPVLFLRRMDKRSTVRLLPDTWDYLVELYGFRAKVGLSLLDRSPIYWTARGYDLLMQGLYGPELTRTLAQVAAHIEPGASVLDVCAGTGRLYFDQLRAKGCDYLGVDVNGHFVMAMRTRGARARRLDLRTDELPTADYVVMVSSYYHFQKQDQDVLARLRRAARKAVILSEPVENLSQHPARWLGRLANRLTDPGTGDFQHRYDAESFARFARDHGASHYQREARSKNALAIFPGAAPSPG